MVGRISCQKLSSLFFIILSIILGIVCEAPSCLVSSAWVQTRNCVNCGERNRILGCTGY